MGSQDRRRRRAGRGRLHSGPEESPHTARAAGQPAAWSDGHARQIPASSERHPREPSAPMFGIRAAGVAPSCDRRQAERRGMSKHLALALAAASVAALLGGGGAATTAATGGSASSSAPRTAAAPGLGGFPAISCEDGKVVGDSPIKHVIYLQFDNV